MQRARSRSMPAGLVFMRRSMRWTRRRVPVGGAREDRAVYVEARAERRRDRASCVHTRTYVMLSDRLRAFVSRFYVDLVARLRRSLYGRKDCTRALCGHAAKALPPPRDAVHRRAAP